MAKVAGQILALRQVALRSLISLLSLVSISACVSTPSPDSSNSRHVEVEDRVVLDGEVLPLPDEPQIKVERLGAEKSMSPVVQSLLVSARDQQSLGDPDAAANSLERALRIESQNPVLWSRLADVRFSQNDWQQAIQLAAKSNTLAGNNVRLRRQNWYLMANAYQAMGDFESAKKYREKLSR